MDTDRLRIRRDYATDACEYEDAATCEKVFETDAPIWEYADALLGPEQVRAPSGAITI